ncbi:MAG: matrixin family metalloprotease [Halobacteriovoraceae bacterium]|nr:matrixin family metalloprotease [Halobacteriovoraceae bacterium]MBT5092668.1 matrixin family metalloprotease [Halobacteriovoraceae bacterium]
MNRKLFALGLVTLLTLSSKAFAFNFTVDFVNGFYWQGFPITMTRFVNDPADQDLLRDLTHQVEDAWEDVTGQDIWNYNEDVLVSTGHFGSYIRWSNNFGAETGFDPARTLAVTIRYTQGTFMNKTEIILNGNNPSLKANTNNLLLKTLLHELGHTVGLDHSNQFAIMQATPSSLTSLTFDDQQGFVAAISQHKDWSAEGFISPLAGSTEEEKSTFLGCGSVELPPSNGSNNGPFGFLFSLILGALLLRIPRPKTRAIRLSI